MNSSGTTHWLSARTINQGLVAQGFPSFEDSAESRSLISTAIASIIAIPGWVILGMVLLATVGICATVIVRTRAELAASALQYQRMTNEVAVMRRTNDSLQTEIKRMTSDPRAIETSARVRLGMVRPTDIVVPIGSTGAISQ